MIISFSTTSDTYSADFLENPIKNGFYFDPIDGAFVPIDMVLDDDDEIDICSGELNEQGHKDTRLLILVLFLLVILLLATIYYHSSKLQ